VIAATLAAGILISHYLAIQSAAFIAFTLAAGLVLTLTSAWLISNKKLAWATVLTITAFLFARFTVASIYGQSMAASRIARLYDEGIIRPTDPVELADVLHGQPESASLSFYLKLRSEKIRFKGSERDASGTVLFLVHVRDQQVQHEYDSLELRHGARVRVITALDREENFRNPGVLPFTEYLERNGYDATGMIKSPLLIDRLNDQHGFPPLAWLYEWRECLQREFNAMF